MAPSARQEGGTCRSSQSPVSVDSYQLRPAEAADCAHYWAYPRREQHHVLTPAQVTAHSTLMTTQTACLQACMCTRRLLFYTHKLSKCWLPLRSFDGLVEVNLCFTEAQLESEEDEKMAFFAAILSLLTR